MTGTSPTRAQTDWKEEGTWWCRFILAGVYLLAAWPKIADPAGFAKAINNYQLVPGGFINAMAVGLPWLELFAALALVFVPPLRRGALWLFTGMTVVFIFAIGSAMKAGIDISCGCFSTSGGGMKTGWLHLLMDFGLLACCVALFRLDRRA